MYVGIELKGEDSFDSCMFDQLKMHVYDSSSLRECFLLRSCTLVSLEAELLVAGTFSDAFKVDPMTHVPWDRGASCVHVLI